MSDYYGIDRDRYRGLLNADRRYGGPNIREEVVMRTACGCTSVVSRAHGGFNGSIDVRLPVDPQSRYGPALDTTGEVQFIARRFVYEGETDPSGRRIYAERIPHPDPVDWRSRYHELHDAIYGVDKGL